MLLRSTTLYENFSANFQDKELNFCEIY